jgi:hypothetical protein
MVKMAKNTSNSWVFYLILMLFVSYSAIGQSRFSDESIVHVVPEWDTLRSENQSSVQVLRSIKDSLGFPHIRLSMISIPQGMRVGEVRIENVRWHQFQLPLAHVTAANYRNPQRLVSWKTGSSRGKYFVLVTLMPVQEISAQGFQGITECDITVRFVPDNGTPTMRKNRSFVTSSVLAPGSGKWSKVAVTSDGIYRIDRSFIQSLGYDPDTIDPASVHIYGNSFGLLPELNSAYRPDDLLEQAVEVSGSGDGSFNQQDYVLFFARGPHSWSYYGGAFHHNIHLYDTRSYYFVRVDNSHPQKQIQLQTPSVLPATHTVTTFNDFAFIEQERENLIKSGRGWYGDNYDVQTDFSYSFNFPNVTGTAELKASLLANGGAYSSSYTVQVNGSPSTLNVGMDPVGTGSYSPKADIEIGSLVFTPSSSTITVDVTYNKPISSAEGWLDYLEMHVRRNLSMASVQMAFRDVDSYGPGNVAEFKVSNASNISRIWDITDPSTIVLIDLPYGSGNQLTFRMSTDTIREYYASIGNQYPSPTFIKHVEHQDVHALGNVDYVIVSAEALMGEAERLADFHRTHGLDVVVVDQEHVYNEFSSGMRDVAAIRDMMRMLYQRAAGDTSLMPRYLLLFGDGSYDNRGIKFPITTHLPTYQSAQSVSVTSSFTSDDFLGLLDDSESMGDNDLMDIGVGRLPVLTLVQARDAVDKIIHYSQNTAPDQTLDCCTQGGDGTMGDWRNVVCFIADDEDGNDYVDGAEAMSVILNADQAAMNIDKIYLDAHLQQATPGGQRYPEAEDKIDRRVQNGALIVNYIGHGGEVGWAHERILNVSTINAWRNSNSLPLFVTATCEFSRYDDPERVSAGEYVFLNADGGGIALLTTTRLVYSWPNEVLNLNFIEVALDPVNNRGARLGDLCMVTKNQTANDISGDNFRNFTLLGDPALRIRLPYFKVITDSVNGMHISITDTIGALGKVRVSGYVADPGTGTIASGLKGYLYPTIYDKQSTLKTLANDAGSYVRNFNMWKNIIYSGKATVTNGRFSFEFVVPKDIGLQYGSGRMSFYFHDDTEDGNGFSQDFVIGGIDTSAASDNTGPQMTVYLNEADFVNGGLTSPNPVLIAELTDENGINTVGNGIGHDITLVLDGETSNSIILNDFYRADLDTYKSGKVKFELADLAPGSHTLTFKAWDVYNNSSETELEFVVAEDAEMAIDHVLNYPNPFTSSTNFMFEHNQGCEQLEVSIQIFTVSGKLVKTISERVDARGFRVSGVMWDGKDEYGDELARGTYLYKIKATTDTGETAEQIERLVILK